MFGSSPLKKFLNAAADGDTAELNRCLTDEVPKLYSIDARGRADRTALILAAKYGKTDTLKILIEKNACLDAADKSGRTALWWACHNGRTEAAKLLIAAGANANTHDNNYYYALHHAARNGDLDVIKALVAGGAELNVVNKSYLETPLHLAVENRHNPSVEYLLAQGARTDLRNYNSNTPYDRAKIMSSRPLKDLIEAAERQRAEALIQRPAAAAPLPETAGESWALLARDKVARIGVYPPINRKITEVFNFESRERLIMTENLKTGAETMSAPEKFETLAEDVVSRAEERLKSLGGSPPDRSSKKAFNL
jgi:hypothetical protein